MNQENPVPPSTSESIGEAPSTASNTATASGASDRSKTATLYRMATPEHLCPFGVKSRWLLKHKGYAVNDHLLTSREAQDAFKAEHDVNTTPQAFIGSQRIGGWDDLRRWFGIKVKDKDATSYQPVIVVFIVRMNTWLRLRLDRVMNV